ncbi:MAG: PmoA family protein [Bacteroidota bacterium]
MMYYNTILVMALAFLIAYTSGQQGQQQEEKEQEPKIELVSKPSETKVDVMIEGKLFTSFLYPNTIKKPVLWPIISGGGNELTRQFPFKQKEGERVDHPHHVGLWLNYGDVNGLDFWNNSDSIDVDKRDEYGTIKNVKILSAESGDVAVLKTESDWLSPDDTKLLDDQTTFTFSLEDGVRIIDRKTTLTAQGQKVTFTDNKEGMLGMRMARELELPIEGKMELSDAKGNITVVENPDNTSVTGNYLSSEGVTGKEVWATRATWMKLAGKMNGENVAVVIYDTKDNIGYPTYWHARDYGLFAANPLGQKIFSEGKQELNFSLEPGESTTFYYRIGIFSEDPSPERIEEFNPNK